MSYLEIDTKPDFNDQTYRYINLQQLITMTL